MKKFSESKVWTGNAQVAIIQQPTRQTFHLMLSNLQLAAFRGQKEGDYVMGKVLF